MDTTPPARPAASTPERGAPRVAADLMDANPPTVLPTSRVGEVAKLMLERHVSGVPVVAETGELIGVVREVDLVTRHANVHFPFYLNILGGVIPLGGEHRFEEEVRRVTGRTAADVMTTRPVTVDEVTPLDDVATRMEKPDGDPVAVLRGDKLAGLITRADLVRLVAIEEDSSASAETA